MTDGDGWIGWSAKRVYDQGRRGATSDVEKSSRVVVAESEVSTVYLVYLMLAVKVLEEVMPEINR